MRFVNAYKLASRRMFLSTKGKWARIQFNVWRKVVSEPFPRQPNTAGFNKRKICDTNLFCRDSMPECWDDMVQCELCEEWLHMSCEGFKTAPEDAFKCMT